jgi:hypothetical protein
MIAIPRRYSHFIFAVIQAGLMCLIAAGIASLPLVTMGQFLVDWLLSWVGKPHKQNRREPCINIDPWQTMIDIRAANGGCHSTRFATPRWHPIGSVEGLNSRRSRTFHVQDISLSG